MYRSRPSERKSRPQTILTVSRMAHVKLAYVNGYRDRHGRQRYYYRRAGRRFPLPGRPGEAEFMRAYEAAAAGYRTCVPPESKVTPGTFDAWFGNWFRDTCDAAGLKGLSAHGLRKSAARRLAEAGCSTKQIAAITGHKTLGEVERYTASADQERMAREAISRLMLAADR